MDFTSVSCLHPQLNKAMSITSFVPLSLSLSLSLSLQPPPPPLPLFITSPYLPSSHYPNQHHHLHPSSKSKTLSNKGGHHLLFFFHLGMDTSSSSSFSSSLDASSSMFGSSGLEADANPSFPYTPSAPGRRWRPRFFSKFISSGGDAHHFLDTCFLCKKPIAANDDIFMYRGDAPFCSAECREEQIEMDEALENNRKKFSSSSSSIRNSSSSSASSTIKHKPSLIIRQNSRNVHAMVAGY